MEPVDRDRALTRQDLFTKVANPRAAANMDDLSKALDDWEPSKRLFATADGKLPNNIKERLAFIDMLPPDVSANVLMHMDMPGYEAYNKIRRYDVKLVKVMRNQCRKPRSGSDLVADVKGDPQDLSQPVRRWRTRRLTPTPAVWISCLWVLP